MCSVVKAPRGSFRRGGRSRAAGSTGSRWLTAASMAWCAARSISARSSGEYSPGCDIAFPATAQDEGAALAPFLHRPGDLRPERHEIIDGGPQREHHHDPDGDLRDPVDGQDEAAELPVRPAAVEDGGDDGDDLHHHLEFAEVAGLDGEALRRG